MVTSEEISALDLLRLSRLMFEEARQFGEGGHYAMFERAAQGRSLLAEAIVLAEETDRRSEEAAFYAAAPDLLAACKALMPDGWDEGHMDHMPGIKLARLAIAKAAGRS